MVAHASEDAKARGTRTLLASRGFTIVETATTLTVMFILAGALAPIVSDSVSTARAVKAANDSRLIATGMIQFERDLGSVVMGDSVVSGSGSTGAGASGRRAAVLVSDGDAPEAGADSETDAPDFRKRFLLNKPGLVAPQSGRAARHAWLEAATGLIDDHLITNRAGHRVKRPSDTSGWNGPYISAVIKSDPWGKRYMVNTGWLSGGATAADEKGDMRRAVFVVSAGDNGVIDTPYDQPINDASLQGDDIGVRIQ